MEQEETKYFLARSLNFSFFQYLLAYKDRTKKGRMNWMYKDQTKYQYLHNNIRRKVSAAILNSVKEDIATITYTKIRNQSAYTQA